MRRLERGVVPARRRPLRVLLDHSPGDRRREQRVAGGDDAHRVHELLGRRVLEQEAAGAGAERLEHVVVLLEGGEDDDAAADAARRRATRRVASRPSSFGIWMSISTTSGCSRRGDRDRLLAVARLADDLEVVLGLEDQPEPGSHQRLVVGEHDA